MALTLASSTSYPTYIGPFKLFVVIATGTTGTGTMTVPHGLGYAPWNVWIQSVDVVTGPAAGPSVFLDTTAAPAGKDATNFYLFFTGAGTANVAVG